MTADRPRPPRLLTDSGVIPDGADTCIVCRAPFDPTDERWDGQAQHRGNPWCRSCRDRCHDSEDAGHRCPICR